MYVNDVCIGVIDGAPSPCRLLGLVWHSGREQLMGSVRLLRTAADVQNMHEERAYEGLGGLHEG